MDQEFMRMLQALRDEIGPMPVTSGFRCDAHNNDVSTVKNGPHTLAKVADILISGERGDAVVRKSPSDWLQWHRIEPERATSQGVHTSRYRGSSRPVELLELHRKGFVPQDEGTLSLIHI